MDSSSGHPSGQDTATEIFPYWSDANQGVTDFRPLDPDVAATPKNSFAPGLASSSALTPEKEEMAGEASAQSPADKDSTPDSPSKTGSPTSSSPPPKNGGHVPPAVTTTQKSSSPQEGKDI